MLPVSAMSDAATNLRALLINQIDDLADEKQVKIGHPKDTMAAMEADLNSVNLFFYHVGYDGYPADGVGENPFYVRLYCLVTAVGANSVGSGSSPGENDLRLIGEVMRVLHEQPVMMVRNSADEDIAELQVVPHSLDLGNLNHIWSTQGDIAYRLSVAYEMSLAPVPLAQPRERAPLVGEVGARSYAHVRYVPLPEDGFGVDTSSPQIPYTVVDTEVPGWLPHICFADVTAASLSYTTVVPKSDLPSSGSLSLKVVLAGKVGDEVELAWETWNAGSGWVREPGTQDETLGGDTIDPTSFFDPLDANTAADVDLPLDDVGQALLYAEREWTRPDGSTATLRSNPLLVTVTGAAA